MNGAVIAGRGGVEEDALESFGRNLGIAFQLIDDTLDYKTLSKRVIAFVEQSDFFLVEKLAEEICSLILAEFDTIWVKLTLNKKGAIRGASDVGIIIERGEK